MMSILKSRYQSIAGCGKACAIFAYKACHDITLLLTVLKHNVLVAWDIGVRFSPSPLPVQLGAHLWLLIQERQQRQPSGQGTDGQLEGLPIC